MGLLSKAKPVTESNQGKLVVLYGKSNSGKTTLASTFPKPILYIVVADDGISSVSKVDGVDCIEVEKCQDINSVLDELMKDTQYATVVVDTFSLYTNMWITENVTSKKKKMTQQAWGDLKTETEELIRLASKLSKNKWVVLTCHEAADAFEGLEDEITPDIRPSVSKGARTYLEGMANYGIHTTKLKKVVEQDGVEKTLVKYGAHIGPNEYYWTKLQIARDVKVPQIIVNPSFDKLIKITKGE